ncbi:hypothetical protein GJ496_010867 [Pomphorhynchus laevis]|nr:hypothetical protein GJ496_010867 [Pomphorhynchus laevis]
MNDIFLNICDEVALKQNDKITYSTCTAMLSILSKRENLESKAFLNCDAEEFKLNLNCLLNRKVSLENLENKARSLEDSFNFLCLNMADLKILESNIDKSYEDIDKLQCLIDMDGILKGLENADYNNMSVSQVVKFYHDMMEIIQESDTIKSDVRYSYCIPFITSLKERCYNIRIKEHILASIKRLSLLPIYDDCIPNLSLTNQLFIILGPSICKSLSQLKIEPCDNEMIHLIWISTPDESFFQPFQILLSELYNKVTYSDHIHKSIVGLVRDHIYDVYGCSLDKINPQNRKQFNEAIATSDILCIAKLKNIICCLDCYAISKECRLLCSKIVDKICSMENFTQPTVYSDNLKIGIAFGDLCQNLDRFVNLVKSNSFCTHTSARIRIERTMRKTLKLFISRFASLKASIQSISDCGLFIYNGFSVLSHNCGHNWSNCIGDTSRLISSIDHECIYAVRTTFGDHNTLFRLVDHIQVFTNIHIQYQSFQLEIFRKVKDIEVLMSIWVDHCARPRVLYCKIGEMFETLFDKLVQIVLNTEDFTMEDSVALEGFFNFLVKTAMNMFKDTEAIESLLPSLPILSELSKLLGLSMTELLDRWQNGPTSDLLTVNQLQHLVKSLFENSDAREKIIQKIR